jgi:AraC family transcriptional regulator
LADEAYDVGFGWAPRVASHFNYACCVGVDCLDDLPEGMVGREIPASRNAVFTHRGPLSSLGTSIDYIWGNWVPKSGLRKVAAPDFGLYDGRSTPEGGEMNIWLPIN